MGLFKKKKATKTTKKVVKKVVKVDAPVAKPAKVIVKAEPTRAEVLERLANSNKR